MPSEESYKKIEGDWKDFRFRRIVPADYKNVFEHISSNFTLDEPTCKLLGFSDDFADDLNRVIEHFLGHGMSFIVEHRETGKIAGVRITFNHTADLSFDSIPINSEQAKILLKMIEDLEGEADVPNKYKINSWAEFFIASTSREFRNQGIVGEFYDRSIEFLRAEGYKHVLVLVSSPYTRKAVQKRGFQPCAKLTYDKVLNLEGQPAFKPELLTNEHFAMVMVKEL